MPELMIEKELVAKLGFWVKQLEVSNKWFLVYDTQMKRNNFDSETTKKRASEKRDVREQEATTAINRINEILPIINQQYNESTEKA